MKTNEAKPNCDQEQHGQQEVPDGGPAEIRRNFLKKFGKYAVSTPAVTFTLMSSMTSKAIASGHIGDDSTGNGS